MSETYPNMHFHWSDAPSVQKSLADFRIDRCADQGRFSRILMFLNGIMKLPAMAITYLASICPRRTSDDQLAAKEAALNKTLSDLANIENINRTAQLLILAQEAGNVDLPHTFTPQPGCYTSNCQPFVMPQSLTLHAIDEDLQTASISTDSLPRMVVTTRTLAEALSMFAYKPGDITYALI